MSSASESRAEKYPAPIPVDVPVTGVGGSLEFSTRVSVEARRLKERDAKLGGAGRKQGWAWHTRAEYSASTVQPHDGYCAYLQAKTSGFWSDKATANLEKIPWNRYQ